MKQNWLGYCEFGNDGRGLGPKFANTLHGALGSVLKNFGDEEITKGTHLEKLSLIQSGVGRDNIISDFTTNLINDFLLNYTEAFAKKHLDPAPCQGDIFRIEVALAAVAAIALLTAPRRVAWVFAPLVGSSALGGVLLYRYFNPGGLGPLPERSSRPDLPSDERRLPPQ